MASVPTQIFTQIPSQISLTINSWSSILFSSAKKVDDFFAKKGIRLHLFDFGPKWECPGMSDHERIQTPEKNIAFFGTRWAPSAVISRVITPINGLK